MFSLQHYLLQLPSTHYYWHISQIIKGELLLSKCNYILVSSYPLSPPFPFDPNYTSRRVKWGEHGMGPMQHWPSTATPSSETQGQSVGPGENARRKFTSMGGRAAGYRLSPDHFQTVKRMLAPDWAQKMVCIIVKNVCVIVNNWRTASPKFFSWVRTRRLLSRHIFPVRSPSFPNQKRRNYRWVEKRLDATSRSNLICTEKIMFWRITMYRK